MKTKTYVLQFLYDERTRWLYSDQDVANTLRNVADSISAVHTNGAEPGVVVTPLKCLAVVDPEKALFAGSQA